MPTGYTAAIKDGISFEQFVWQCARAMGALVTMRDSPGDAPIPERFEPSGFYVKEAGKVRAEIARLESMPIEQVEAEAEAAFQRSVQHHADRQREALELRNKYSGMLAKVVDWKPPTKDHEGFQRFMADQIRQSIDFDCNTSYVKEPRRRDSTAWHNDQIAALRAGLVRYESEHQKEVERTEERNTWLQELRASVPQMQP